MLIISRTFLSRILKNQSLNKSALKKNNSVFMRLSALIFQDSAMSVHPIYIIFNRRALVRYHLSCSLSEIQNVQRHLANIALFGALVKGQSPVDFTSLTSFRFLPFLSPQKMCTKKYVTVDTRINSQILILFRNSYYLNILLNNRKLC